MAHHGERLVCISMSTQHHPRWRKRTSGSINASGVQLIDDIHTPIRPARLASLLAITALACFAGLIPRLTTLALLSSLRPLIAGITAVAFPTAFTPEPLPLSTLGNYTLLLLRERHRVEVEDGRVRVASGASLGRRASPRRRGATGTTWSLTGRWHSASPKSFFVVVNSSS